ncbi:MAG: SAM-dependent methyltransferase [Streptosporangiales bacterium]|nr:SAM-dependent methyltransferase [Streptosporangiales bacterium]
MYDYFLGGKDNYASDRQAATEVLKAFPEARQLARANRRFLARAVRYCAESGVDQFLDVGTGIPTSPNVPDVAREVHPGARVVGVDNDPVVLAHDRALVETHEGIRILPGDLRRPKAFLTDPELHEVLDASRPIAVLLVAVLHFVTDAEDPAGILAAFDEVMAPGSFLVISAATSTGTDPEALARIEQVYARASSPAVFRPAEGIRTWFDGFDLHEPGLVDVSHWPSPAGVRPSVRVLAGVARKPEAEEGLSLFAHKLSP